MLLESNIHSYFNTPSLERKTRAGKSRIFPVETSNQNWGPAEANKYSSYRSLRKCQASLYARLHTFSFSGFHETVTRANEDPCQQSDLLPIITMTRENQRDPQLLPKVRFELTEQWPLKTNIWSAAEPWHPFCVIFYDSEKILRNVFMCISF
jgi:hypothetical protein